MANKEDDKRKKRGWLFLLLGIILVAGIATVLTLTLGKGGGAEAERDRRSAEEIELARKLAAEGSDTISIDSDIDIVSTLVVVGDKTLTGSGKITSTGQGEYVITLAEGSTLNLDGPTIESTEDGAKNGIYVSETAAFNLLSGSVRNLKGHGVRNLGTASVTGGEIADVGTNWLMVDSGSQVKMNAGSFYNAGEAGILVGSNATFEYGKDAALDGAVDNLVYNLGTFNIDGGSFANHQDYALYNNGIMEIKNVEFKGASVLGYLHNGEDGVMKVSDTKFLDSSTDFIYNQCDMTLTDVMLGTCNNQAIENAYGTLKMTNVTADKIGGNFLLNRKGTANLENITIDSVGTDIVYNRASDVTIKGLKVNTVGGSGFLNDFLTAASTAGAGNVTLEDFDIGSVKVNGIRSNGGVVLFKNGKFGICENHGVYAKAGEFTSDTVDYMGTAPGKCVVLIGYNTNKDTVAVFKNSNITGGARGLQNYAKTTWESGTIYGNKSSGTYNIGAGIKNSGELTFLAGTIRDNHAKSSGGGIYNEGTLLFKGGTIKNNSTKMSGGGIRNSINGIVKVYGGTIYNNTAESYGGGIASAGNLKFYGGTVSSNSCAKSGGGIAITGDTTGKVKTAGIGILSGGTVKKNTSKMSGGGVYVGASADYAVLEGVKITDNKISGSSSGGGISSLGKVYIYSGTKITGNKSTTYGGGVYNSLSSDGTKHGTMYIKGGTITGNTAQTKGGGGVYNRGVMYISGGTIKGNNISENVNGLSVYNSGDLTVSGGKYDGLTEKPYDIYSYKGAVYFKGSPKLGSYYKAALASTYIKGNLKVDKNIKYYMTRYIVGTQAFLGTTKLISTNKNKFDIKDVVTSYIPAASDTTTKYVNNKGVITRNGIDLDAKEAILLDSNGNEIYRGLFSIAVSEASDGDTIKIISDVTVDESLALSYFTSTASNEGKSKTINITDDGKAHTVSLASGDEAAFYIASSAGGGNGKPSDSGYYKTYMNVNIKGHGLTFKGAEDMHSAAFYISGPADVKITGDVKFVGLRNEGGWAQNANGDYIDKPTHSSGNNGGAISTGASSKLTIDGATFEDCGTSRGGALYINGDAIIKNCTFTGNTTENVPFEKDGAAAITNGNGAAIYVTSTGNVKVTGSEFTDNKANNGGAIYVYGGTLSVKDSVFTDNKSDDVSGGQAIYVTNKPADGDAPAIYGSASLSGVTVTGSGNGNYGVVQKENVTLTVSGKTVIDAISVPGELALDGALKSGSDVTLIVPGSAYVPGNKVVTGTGVADSYTYITVNNGMLTLNSEGVLEGELVVAKIGDTTYASFDAALAAAENGDTIELLMDCDNDNGDGSNNVTKNITLDLCGYTLDGSHSRAVFRIASGASLTIKDSVGGGVVQNLKGSNNQGAVVSVNGGTLNLESGTLTGKLTGSNTNNNGGAVRIQSGGVFNMTGGTIKDCEAKNGGAVFVNNGTFNMTGGEIKDIKTNASTSAAIHARNSGKVLISGDAKIACDFSLANVDENGNSWSGEPGTISISGGYFTTDEYTGYLEDMYAFIEDTSVEGYSYRVDTAAVAKVGDVLYDSLEEAVDAAAGDSTITLLANTEIDTAQKSLAINKKLTIDLAGMTVSSTGTKPVFDINGGTLTITDSKGNGAIKPGAADTGARLATVRSGSVLTLAGGTIDGNNTEAAAGAILVSGGRFEMTGGTVKDFKSTGGAGAVTVTDDGKVKLTGGEITGIVSADGYADINAASAAMPSVRDEATILIIDEAIIDASMTKAGTWIAGGCFSKKASDSIDVEATEAIIAGGYYTQQITHCASGYACVEDTEKEGYPYKVVASEYQQPGGTDGKDLGDLDEF